MAGREKREREEVNGSVRFCSQYLSPVVDNGMTRGRGDRYSDVSYTFRLEYGTYSLQIRTSSYPLVG